MSFLCNLLQGLQHEDGRQPVSWQPAFQFALHTFYYCYYNSNRKFCQYEYIHVLKQLLGVPIYGVSLYILYLGNGEIQYRCTDTKQFPQGIFKLFLGQLWQSCIPGVRHRLWLQVPVYFNKRTGQSVVQQQIREEYGEKGILSFVRQEREKTIDKVGDSIIKSQKVNRRLC